MSVSRVVALGFCVGGMLALNHMRISGDRSFDFRSRLKLLSQVSPSDVLERQETFGQRIEPHLKYSMYMYQSSLKTFQRIEGYFTFQDITNRNSLVSLGKTLFRDHELYVYHRRPRLLTFGMSSNSQLKNATTHPQKKHRRPRMVTFGMSSNSPLKNGKTRKKKNLQRAQTIVGFRDVLMHEYNRDGGQEPKVAKLQIVKQQQRDYVIKVNGVPGRLRLAKAHQLWLFEVQREKLSTDKQRVVHRWADEAHWKAVVNFLPASVLWVSESHDVK